MPFEDGRPTPDEIERQRQLDAYRALENARPVTQKISDEAEQVSNRSGVYYGAIAVTIATVIIGAVVVAIHGLL